MSQLQFAMEGGRPEPEFLTVAEAAERVRCHERTVRRAIDSGALRAGQVRRAHGTQGAYRIRPADLQRWLYEDD